MYLKDIGEFGFIDNIRSKGLIRPDGVYKGIGDDAAAFMTAPDRLTLVTTDLLVEGVHFLRPEISGSQLGHKALAVNMSDIAAMGGIPREAFISLAIPDDCPLEYLEEFYQGMYNLAEEFAVNVLGGDTTASRRDLMVNVALTGEVAETEILCRNTARPGDLICTTGCLGDSRAGLHLLVNGIRDRNADLEELFVAHGVPRPHLREGRFLAVSGLVSAAMDISDGLSSDLRHLTSAGVTGARISVQDVPVSSKLQTFCDRFRFDPKQWALAGGEDYTLLFTVSPENVRKLAAAYRHEFGAGFYVLGEMTDTGRLELVDSSGMVHPWPESGWNHFRRTDKLVDDS